MNVLFLKFASVLCFASSLTACNDSNSSQNFTTILNTSIPSFSPGGLEDNNTDDSEDSSANNPGDSNSNGETEQKPAVTTLELLQLSTSENTIDLHNHFHTLDLSAYLTTKAKNVIVEHSKLNPELLEKVTWHVDNPSLAAIKNGVLTPLIAGDITIRASHGGVYSNPVKITVYAPQITVCDDADASYSTACLKSWQTTPEEGFVADLKDSIFVGNPSKVVMNALGYQESTDEFNSGRTFHSYFNEDLAANSESLDQTGVDFAMFTQTGLNAINDNTSPLYGMGGQLDRFCQTLNAIEFQGKTNWHRASIFELVAFDIAATAAGAATSTVDFVKHWPTAKPYASSSAGTTENTYFSMGFADTYGRALTTISNIDPSYATCISNEPSVMIGISMFKGLEFHLDSDSTSFYTNDQLNPNLSIVAGERLKVNALGIYSIAPTSDNGSTFDRYEKLNDVNFNSSNQSVAIVSSKGVVTALSAGVTEISILFTNDKDGLEYSKTFLLAVNEHIRQPENLRFTVDNKTMQINDSFDLKALLVYSDMYLEDHTKDITWSYSKDGIVDAQQGKITALSAGEVTLTATIAGKMCLATKTDCSASITVLVN